MKKFVPAVLTCVCIFILAGCNVNSTITSEVGQKQQEREAKNKLVVAEQVEFNAEYRKAQAEQEIKDTGFISNALSHVPLLGKLTKAGKAKQKLKEAEQEMVEAEAASDEARTNYAAVTGTSVAVSQQPFLRKNMMRIIVGVAGFIFLALTIFLMSRSRKDLINTAISHPESLGSPRTAVAVSGNYDRNKALEKWCKKAGISLQEALSASGGDQEAAVQYAMDRASGLR